MWMIPWSWRHSHFHLAVYTVFVHLVLPCVLPLLADLLRLPLLCCSQHYVQCVDSKCVGGIVLLTLEMVHILPFAMFHIDIVISKTNSKVSGNYCAIESFIYERYCFE